MRMSKKELERNEWALQEENQAYACNFPTGKSQVAHRSLILFVEF